MEALTAGGLPLSEWEAGFVDQLAWRSPAALTPRQAATIARICWRHRDRLPPALAPDREPKLPPRSDR
jgi:hypothetical protein